MRLLSLSLTEIDQLAKDMEAEIKANKDDLYRICWYMRGSLSFSEAYELTIEDREIISNIIKTNLEFTKDTSLPFF